MATDETVKSTLSDHMADEPNEMYTTIDNESDKPEEAQKNVDPKASEVKA